MASQLKNVFFFLIDLMFFVIKLVDNSVLYITNQFKKKKIY